MKNKQKMRLIESSIPKGKSEVKQRNDTKWKGSGVSGWGMQHKHRYIGSQQSLWAHICYLSLSNWFWNIKQSMCLS